MEKDYLVETIDYAGREDFILFTCEREQLESIFQEQFSGVLIRIVNIWIKEN